MEEKERTDPTTVLPGSDKITQQTITQNVVFHGRLFEEGKILALAHALEAKLEVGHHRPPIG